MKRFVYFILNSLLYQGRGISIVWYPLSLFIDVTLEYFGHYLDTHVCHCFLLKRPFPSIDYRNTLDTSRNLYHLCVTYKQLLLLPRKNLTTESPRVLSITKYSLWYILTSRNPGNNLFREPTSSSDQKEWVLRWGIVYHDIALRS